MTPIARIIVDVFPPDANGRHPVSVNTPIPPGSAINVMLDAIEALKQPPKQSGIEIPTPEVTKRLLAAR